MEDEEWRKAFVGDEGNVDLAIDDIVEVSGPCCAPWRPRTRANKRAEPWPGCAPSFASIETTFPAERVLVAAIAKLKDLEATIADDGFIAETTLLAIKYFAEATTEETRFSGANRRRALDRYRTAISSIDGVDRLRRETGFDRDPE